MPTKLPNVLVVIADTVRADHLSVYGYQRETSPLMARRLASSTGWTLFERCYSTAGWTLPACASIMTGQSPDRHGLVDHSRRFTTDKLSTALRPTHRTVGIGNNGNLVSDALSAETLDSLGLARRPKKWNHFGWDDGFDRYEWFPHDQHWKALNKAQRLLRRWRHEPPGGQPWFMMLHTNLAHDYNLDRPYYDGGERFLGRPIDPELRSFRDGPEIWNELGGQLSDLTQQIVAKYDAGLGRLDRALNNIVDEVDLDNTIVVIVSDHGEGFDLERGRVHHCGRLHEDLLHVPLLVHTPQSVAGASSVPRVVRHARSVTDIMPTVLRMVDGTSSSLFDGTDLFGPERHRTIHAMDSAYLYRPDERPIRRLSSDHGPLRIDSYINYPLKTTTYSWEPQQRAIEQVNLVYDPLEDELAAGDQSAASQLQAVTVVVDFDEYAHNLAQSPDIAKGLLRLEVIDNRGNQAGEGIGALYAAAQERLSSGSAPLVFVHPDVYLPAGWVERITTKLSELTALDPTWGVAGIAGRVHGSIDRGETGKGHWADPHGHRRFGPLPHKVDVIDELVMIVRDGTLAFDKHMPGFHCYGTDLCATAHEAGRSVWVVEAFAWHKMRQSDRSLVARSDRSAKIAERTENSFSDAFALSAAYVRDKWQGKQTLSGMTEFWRDFYGEG